MDDRFAIPILKNFFLFPGFRRQVDEFCHQGQIGHKEQRQPHGHSGLFVFGRDLCSHHNAQRQQAEFQQRYGFLVRFLQVTVSQGKQLFHGWSLPCFFFIMADSAVPVKRFLPVRFMGPSFCYSKDTPKGPARRQPVFSGKDAFAKGEP